MSQLAFDLELDIPKDTGFSDMQTTENGKCSRCLRALKGNYGRSHGALRDGLWFAWCDSCTESERR